MATSLPRYIADNLHLLRSIGNRAAHPDADPAGLIVKVEHEEAELTLAVIEQLFDRYFVGPAKAAAIRAKYPAQG